MNIGISTIHVVPGKSGSHEPYMINFIHALAGLKTQHKFTLFVTPANQNLFESARGEMDFVVYPKMAGRVLPRILFEQLRLPIDAYRRKIDVMHYPGTAASLFIRPSDVVTVHHDSVTQRVSMTAMHNFYYDIVFRIIRRAGKLITPSRVYADQLVHYFRFAPEQMCPIHHGVNPAFREVSFVDLVNIQKKYGIEKDAILTVTNTLPHKNISNLLQAYEILLSKYGLNNQLVMVGYVDEDILDTLIKRIASDPEKMRSRIKVISFMPHEQLPPIYFASSFFVFYSLTETFGMPIVEALASGLPVVASDIPVHREILSDGGELVSPEKPESLASKLYMIITDISIRERMKKTAIARSHSFSWEQTALQTIQVYENAYSSYTKIRRGQEK